MARYAADTEVPPIDPATRSSQNGSDYINFYF
jgi:hypothetical protein